MTFLEYLQLTVEELKGLDRPHAAFANKTERTWVPKARAKDDRETWSRDAAVARRNEKLLGKDSPTSSPKAKLKRKGMETFQPSKTFLRPPPREGAR